MYTDNDKNETDLEKEYEGSESVSDTAMVTLMEITKKKFLRLNNLNNLKLNNLKKKKNYIWKKLNNSKGSLTETWHLKDWRWNKK